MSIPIFILIALTLLLGTGYLIYLLINYNLKISQVNQLELKSRRLQLKFHFDLTISLMKQTNY